MAYVKKTYDENDELVYPLTMDKAVAVSKYGANAYELLHYYLKHARVAFFNGIVDANSATVDTSKRTLFAESSKVLFYKTMKLFVAYESASGLAKITAYTDFCNIADYMEGVPSGSEVVYNSPYKDKLYVNMADRCLYAWDGTDLNRLSESIYTLTDAAFKDVATSFDKDSASDDELPTTKAVFDFVSSYMEDMSSGMTFKGVLAPTSGTSMSTPAGVLGDFYKINYNGTLNGIAVEVGDSAYCIEDDTTGGTASKWSIINRNVDSLVDFGVQFASYSKQSATTTLQVLATTTPYTLKTSNIVCVYFAYDVPASAQLKVGNSTAKPIWIDAAVTSGRIKAGDVVTFIYDGTHWRAVGHVVKNVARIENVTEVTSATEDTAILALFA